MVLGCFDFKLIIFNKYFEVSIITKDISILKTVNLWKSYIWTADKDVTTKIDHYCEDRFHIHI